MIRAAAVLLGCALSLGSLPASADTLAEIYELALENDAQLKAQQAQYKANLEIENLGRAALLPQINAGYDYSDIDRDTEGTGSAVQHPFPVALVYCHNND